MIEQQNHYISIYNSNQKIETKEYSEERTLREFEVMSAIQRHAEQFSYDERTYVFHNVVIDDVKQKFIFVFRMSKDLGYGIHLIRLCVQNSSKQKEREWYLSINDRTDEINWKESYNLKSIK